MTKPPVDSTNRTACPNCSGPATAYEDEIKCEKCNSPKNIKEIVKAFLEKNGFDGLFDDLGACGCENSDLMPCDESVWNCLPGYKIKCDPESCELGGDCEWHISPEKDKDI